MARYRNLPAGVRLIINISIILVFLAGLFCLGMWAYAGIYKISYAAAWANLGAALRSIGK